MVPVDGKSADALLPTVQVKRLAADAGLPVHMSSGAAGMDLVAAGEERTLLPGQRALVPTGIAVAIESGYEGQVRPRSGLAVKHGVTVLNAPGTIDSDYRGEVKVILINHGDKAFVVTPGERIAQLVIAPVCQVTVVEVQKLDSTHRGEGGFGSTGS